MAWNGGRGEAMTIVLIGNLVVTAMIPTIVMSRTNHDDNGGDRTMRRSILRMGNHPIREGRGGQKMAVPQHAAVGELRRMQEFHC
jgi:hypothetical protein